MPELARIESWSSRNPCEQLLHRYFRALFSFLIGLPIVGTEDRLMRRILTESWIPWCCVGALPLLLLILSGCADVKEDRLKAYNDDGVQLFQRGNYGAAGESFQAALSLKPDDPGLLYN